MFNASEGPEALAKLIDGLDRSKLHVVQVRLGHPAVYMKPGFGARNYQTPLDYAYDNPKAPNVPAAALRSPEERAGMYAQEAGRAGLADRHVLPGERRQPLRLHPATA